MKRTSLVRKVLLKAHEKLLQPSAMSQGLARNLAHQAHQLLKPHDRRKPFSRAKPPEVKTVLFRRTLMHTCVCCIAGYPQVASSNRHQKGKGTGVKAHYLATFPLCCTRLGIPGCHVGHDQCIAMTREKASDRTDVYMAGTRRQPGMNP